MVMKVSNPIALVASNGFDVEVNPFCDLKGNCLPVRGRDLKKLADQLELSVMDSSWFYGVTVAAWYEYTKEPAEKIRTHYRNKIKKLEDKRLKLIKKIQGSRDKTLKEQLDALDSRIESLEVECIQSCAKKEKGELQVCLPRRRQSVSGKTGRVSAKNPWNAVELPLALLVRITERMPFLTQSLSLSDPDIEQFSSFFKPYTDKNFSYYLGRDENAGYRWMKGMNPPSTAVKRLIHLLSIWFLMEPSGLKGQRVQWWIELVDQERKVLRHRADSDLNASLSVENGNHPGL